MKVAITVWGGRVSPVFDTARELLISQIENGRIAEQHREPLLEQAPAQRVSRLRKLHVEILICGAVSRPLAELLVAGGIQLIAFVAGDATAALTAFLHNELPGPDFLMPGCRAGGGRCRNRLGKTPENVMMNERKGRGMGAGRGQGGGQGAGMGAGRGQGGGQGGGMGAGRGQGGGRGRLGGPAAGGPVGNCVCPQCNETVAHERGVPCSERQCPRCGAALVRA